jgi:serine-type D-Ala-D-Ala carboxypeptidase (penicillin-binding protein 5/6)
MSPQAPAGSAATAREGRLRPALLTALASAVAVAVLVVAAHLLSGAQRPAAPEPPRVRAVAAVVMDQATGVVLYAKAPHRHLPTASLAKVMTALLVVERERDLDRYVVVPPAAASQQGAAIGLTAGDRITVRELLLGLMVKSASDCAVTLATAVAGDETRFAALMNARAAALGLTDTHFVNATGLTEPGLYSSARDLSVLGRSAMHYRRFRALARRVWALVTWPPHHRVFVVSHNRLNARYSWVDGIKTGRTGGTGCCLIASGRYAGRRLIVTTLREPNRDQEVRDALRLFAYGASQYAQRTLVRRGERVGGLKASDGEKIALVAADDLIRTVRKGAPVRHRLHTTAVAIRGAVSGTAGTVSYWSDGVLLGTVALRTASP